LQYHIIVQVFNTKFSSFLQTSLPTCPAISITIRVRQRTDLHDQLKQAVSSWANVNAAATPYMWALPWAGTGGAARCAG
jgi:hypothetical protein